MSIRVLALSLSVLLATCAPSGPQVDLNAERTAITALGDTYVQLFGNKDSGGLAELYTMEAVRMFPGQAPDRDRDAIAIAIQAGFDGGSQSLAIQPDETFIAEDGKSAVASGTYEVDVTPPDGEPVKASGNYMNALTKDADGSWRIRMSLVAPTPVVAP